MKAKVATLIGLVAVLAVLGFVFKDAQIDSDVTLAGNTNTGSSNQRIGDLPVQTNSTSTAFDVIKNADGTTTYIKKPTPEPTEKKAYTISGKFEQKKRSYGMIASDEPPKEYMCNTFTITSGDSEFIDKYEQLVRSGNTVNYLDSNGNLVINLDLQKTSPDLATKITSSTQSITLSVVEKDPSEKDAEPCQSFIEIQGVK